MADREVILWKGEIKKASFNIRKHHRTAYIGQCYEYTESTQRKPMTFTMMLATLEGKEYDTKLDYVLQRRRKVYGV